jgi:nucleoid DNA-binding protein
MRTSLTPRRSVVVDGGGDPRGEHTLAEHGSIAPKDVSAMHTVDPSYLALRAIVSYFIATKGRVTLPELGELSVRRYEAYVGRHPHTLEQVEVPAKFLLPLRRSQRKSAATARSS